ncbi:hypothetical protein [Mesobacillus maritimus]|uniref:UPF0738 family protein n=1 Tax=Mesobacillus maritimus TaxID=1643336 RepID=UPI003851065B
MNQKIHIKTAEIKDQELILFTDEPQNLNALISTGLMLVDSDQLSFIYIAELDGEYNYVNIPKEVWHVVNNGLKSALEVYVANQNGRLHLQAFIEEMNYLIENIKGNTNYGEEMVEKVETIFN